MSDETSIITPFCQFIESNQSDKDSALIGILKKTKKLYFKTTSNLNINFSEFEHHVDDNYLDYFINELLSYYTIKGAGLSNIQEWLNENNIKFEDLDTFKYPKDLNAFFELPYDSISTKYDIDEMLEVRRNIIDYFNDKYAQLMIEFLESKKTNNKNSLNPHLIVNNKNVEKHIKSNRIVTLLSENILNLNSFHENLQNKYAGSDFDLPITIEMYEMDRDSGRKAFLDDIKNNLSDLYHQSIEDSFLYFDSPAIVYERTFKKRFINYIEENIEAGMVEFLKSEIKYLSRPEENRVLYINDQSINYHNYIDDADKYPISFKKKLDFIDNKLKENGYSIDLTFDNPFDLELDAQDYFKYGKRIDIVKLKEGIKESEILEAQTKSKKTKQLTANQIVILLDKVAFFSFPKIENSSKAAQSRLVSMITGLNDKNLKSHIEKLDKNHKDSKPNHKKDLDKIDDILNNLE